LVEITDILDEARDLAEKIKKYREEAESETIACWIYDVILSMEDWLKSLKNYKIG